MYSVNIHQCVRALVIAAGIAARLSNRREECLDWSLVVYAVRMHMWSRNKINSVLATIYFISAPSVRTCRAEIK